MKKLLSLALVLCLLAVAPLMAGATDQTSDGSEKLSLNFAMQVAGDEADTGDVQAINTVMGYVAGLDLDMVFAFHDDSLQAVISLMQEEKNLGTVEVFIDQETFNVRGDMLPEGWLSMELEDLATAMDLDSLSEQMKEAMGQQQAVMETGVTIVQVLADAAEDWLMERDDLLEEKSTDGLSADMDPVSTWGRVHIPAEMYPEIFENANAQLKELVAQGTLKDFDGSVISADAYEESTVGQMMGEMVDAFSTVKVEGVIDILMDDKGGLPGWAVDVSANEASFFMRMTRKTAESGDVNWTGDYQVRQVDQNGRMDGGISAATTSAAGDQRADFSMTGKYQWVPSYNSASGSSETMDFDVTAYFVMPEDESTFDGRMDFHVNSPERDEDFLIWFATRGEEKGAQAADVTFSAGFDVKSDVHMKADMELGMAYEHLEEGLEKPDLTAEDRVFLMDLDDEAQQTYEKQLSDALTMWSVRLMASMPSDLLLMMMNMNY